MLRPIHLYSCMCQTVLKAGQVVHIISMPALRQEDDELEACLELRMAFCILKQ